MDKANTPTLAKVINDSIENRLSDLNVCLPGKVVAVDSSLLHCDVQPVLKRKYADETVVTLPVISRVPIAHYRAGQAFISLPLKVGDFVMLIFSQRSLDLWKTLGGTLDPLDSRKFHLTDGVAYPGVYPFTDPPLGADSDKIIIKNALAFIEIAPTGEVVIRNDAGTLTASATGGLTFENESGEIAITPTGALTFENSAQAVFEVTASGKHKIENATAEYFATMIEFIDELIGLTVVDPISGALPLSPAVIVNLGLIKVKLQSFVP